MTHRRMVDYKVMHMMVFTAVQISLRAMGDGFNFLVQPHTALNISATKQFFGNLCDVKSHFHKTHFNLNRE